MSTSTAVQTSTITGEVGDDRVLVLTIDDPTQATNTMNDAFGQSLASTIDWLEAHRDDFDGVIVTSGKDSFFSGGDLELLRDAGPNDHAAISGALDFTKDKFRRLERLGKPVVAALGGTALGGGYEIALACHYRIALDKKSSRFGLPEVTLGLLPGAGGVTRTVRMFGVVEALTRVVGQGQRYRPAQALEFGLVDEVVDTEEAMMAAARDWIAAHPDAAQPWDRDGFEIPGGTAASPGLADRLPALTAAASVRTPVKGAPMPAPLAVIAAAVEGSVLDFDSASLVETGHCTSLACGPVSGNLIQSMFFDLGSINKGASRPPAEPQRVPEKVLVIGAGMMGAAIAYVVASAKVPVVLRDVSIESAERGKDYARSILGKSVAKGRTTQEAADAVLSLITASADAADTEGCDLVVEAVFEDPAVKQSAFEAVDKYLTADALLCSNTSTLPITALAEGVSRESDFVGTHFFSPVDKMPLVEIVVGEHTSDSALARAFDFVRLIGKTPIVVGDSHGFFTTRVIGRFMDEAISMVAEGVHPSTVEQAAFHAGYPSGALALMDEISLTLSRHIREGMAEAARADGREWIDSKSYALVDRMVDEFERPGRKSGRGFYDYAEDGSKAGLWPGLVEHYLRADHGIPFEDMMDRMLIAQSLDSIACFDEGVLRTVADANIGSIMGIGYPAWTGGVLQFVNQFDGGLPGFVDRADELRARYGDRFIVPSSLRSRTERYL